MTAIQVDIRDTVSLVFQTAKSLLKKHDLASQLLALPYSLFFSPHQKVLAHLIEGTVKGTNLTTTTLYVGSESSLHQFASLAYSQPFEITRKGEFPFRCAASFSDAYPAEIIAIRVEKPLARRYYEQNFLLLPNVSFILDLRKPMHEIIRRMSRRRRRDLKKIEESHYTYTIHRQDSEVFNFFYWKMYLPYATKRFEKAAYIKTFLQSRVIYRLNGGIVIVRKDNQPLAGILFQVQGKTLLAWSLGVYEGNQDFLKASEAALLHLIAWAKREGIKALDYGVSMPYLRDGVFTYKREWGMSVREPVDQSFCALKLNSLTEGSLAFLKQNPFVIHDHRFIKGVILLDHNPNKIEFQELFARYYLPGLASLIVLSYYHDPSPGLSDEIDSRTSSRDLIHRFAGALQNMCVLLREQGYHTRLTELNSMPGDSYRT